ncbi:hypothetical protein PoB_004303000 [Plakobranchus ocellatus]|uniref:Uncharacterized protein n=1 Tax=Plakobranchus ocellatus TaxID=259542 RepID=A0AAV4B7F4_9GAST|nr:hypothetical protein PoB_004303000 [Plakobranchus ocellatus]
MAEQSSTTGKSDANEGDQQTGGNNQITNTPQDGKNNEITYTQQTGGNDQRIDTQQAGGSNHRVTTSVSTEEQSRNRDIQECAHFSKSAVIIESYRDLFKVEWSS